MAVPTENHQNSNSKSTSTSDTRSVGVTANKSVSRQAHIDVWPHGPDRNLHDKTMPKASHACSTRNSSKTAVQLSSLSAPRIGRAGQPEKLIQGPGLLAMAASRTFSSPGALAWRGAGNAPSGQAGMGGLEGYLTCAPVDNGNDAIRAARGRWHQGRSNEMPRRDTLIAPEVRSGIQGGSARAEASPW